MDITLALGAGGAKGNAHIGVLRRLEQEGYKIRSVAGTSFGGLIGILYASGCSPSELLDIFEAVDQANLYGRDADDGPSILGFSGIRKWLDEVVGEKTFDDLHIPCAVIAVDVKSGDEVIITEGNLKDAILSTIALPGIFPIQQLNDWELIDGGVLNPVPVSVARILSPNLPIVAVILNDPMDKPVRTFTIPVPSSLPRLIVDQITRTNFAQSWDIFMRAVEIGSRGVAQFRLELDEPDVIIRPAVHEVELFDNVIVADVAQLGDDAVAAVLPKLKRAVSWWQRRIGKKLFGTQHES